MSGTTVPVLARDVQPGEVLAANPLVSPRAALVVASHWLDDTQTVVCLQVLDMPAWPFESAEVTELSFEYAAGHKLNVLVSELYQ